MHHISLVASSVSTRLHHRHPQPKKDLLRHGLSRLRIAFQLRTWPPEDAEENNRNYRLSGGKRLLVPHAMVKAVVNH